MAVLVNLQRKAQESGLSLDIGELPETNTGNTDNTDDPQRLLNLTSHLIARIADRFAILRKFSRHMEGTERRAGILSDAFAALVCLYQRNPEALEGLGKQYAQEVAQRARERKAEKQASTNGNQAQPTGGVTHATP